ncbi:Peptidyl-prolyl cis-trans isomerase [Diplonema papillatum]|nr:Peptidyl-prolyl cis-trans isomerase [Diplonema papillatum]|eukprot:gene10313-15863_t
MAEVPAKFTVVFETDVAGGENIEVKVLTSDAPLGAARLYELVGDGFFDEAVFFRVVPGFIVQFGIAADPSMTEAWAEPLTDEPLKLSNTEGTLVYATSGVNTRSTQLFFNLGDNSSKLDDKGFTPVGTVVNFEETLETTLQKVKNPTPDDKSGIEQGDYEQKGNDWLLQEYPEVNMITRAYIKK